MTNKQVRKAGAKMFHNNKTLAEMPKSVEAAEATLFLGITPQRDCRENAQGTIELAQTAKPKQV